MELYLEFFFFVMFNITVNKKVTKIVEMCCKKHWGEGIMRL